jgi:hypothetical protein
MFSDLGAKRKCPSRTGISWAGSPWYTSIADGSVSTGLRPELAEGGDLLAAGRRKEKAAGFAQNPAALNLCGIDI